MRSPCSIWQGSRNGAKQNEYGYFRRGGKKILAHRHAWEKANGPIPDGLHVLHRCNRKRCVNPAHLYIGTHQKNMADAKRDGLLMQRNVITHCRNGHRFSEDNIYWSKTGYRTCRTCSKKKSLEYQRRKAK